MYAPGIPDKKKKRQIPRYKNQKLLFAIQEHHTERAGKHYDIRIGDPSTGVAYSWATRNLPKPGESRLIVRQPDHTVDYMNFSGQIQSGYGKGRVSLVTSKDIVVLESNNRKIHFLVPVGNTHEEYVAVHTGGDRWLLKNISKRKDDVYGIGSKPKYKEKPSTRLDPYNRDEVWEPKVDGAHVVINIEKGKVPRVYSVRPPKNIDIPIEHTYRIFSKEHKATRIPANNLIMRGEVFAVRNRTGKRVRAKDVAGILNSSITEVQKRLAEKGMSLKLMPFDVEKADGKEIESYNDAVKLINSVIEAIGGPLIKPEYADTPEKKISLLKKIKTGKHKLTDEGIVIWKTKPKAPVKVKFKKEYDVYIREIFPIESPVKKNMAGGFWYSYTPHGRIVGKVGTGFTDKDRRDMWRNPEKWIGRVAVVEAQEKFPSGALRAPSFKLVHMDK